MGSASPIGRKWVRLCVLDSYACPPVAFLDSVNSDFLLLRIGGNPRPAGRPADRPGRPAGAAGAAGTATEFRSRFRMEIAHFLEVANSLFGA